jgi:hypothetical protein
MRTGQRQGGKARRRWPQIGKKIGKDRLSAKLDRLSIHCRTSIGN